MMASTAAELFSFANYLADEAAKISLTYFRQPLDIESKAGGYPVTIVDKQIELHLRELIQQRYPTHGVIAEEFANNKTQAKYIWVLDPIDGTVAFSSGKPTFTTLIALLHNGQPVLGVIDQPFLNERFSSQDGNSATLNGVLIKTATQDQLAQARLNATTPYMFRTSYEREKFELVHQQVKLTSFGGDAYAFGLLALGHIDVIMEADLEYYDVAALVPLITGSGGVISDWQGKPLTQTFNGQCLACSNLQLQQQVLAIVNG